MNILVIGVGSAGQRHLRVMSNLFGKEANIYAYRGPHRRGLIAVDLQAEDFTQNPIEKYGAEELNTLPELGLKSWDLVVIATPPDSHLEYTKLIISKSKRILIEKPISVSPDDANTICDLARANNIPVLIGYQMAFHPLKDLILESLPLLGKVLRCSTTFSEDISMMNPFRCMQTHHLSTSAGGGVFLSLSHDLDFMLSIFSQTRAQAFSFTDKAYLEGGALAKCTLHASFNSSLGVVNMINRFSILPGRTQRFGEIRGTISLISWNLMDGTFVIKNLNGEIVRSEFFMIEKDELFRRQIESIMQLEVFTDSCLENIARSVFIAETSPLPEI